MDDDDRWLQMFGAVAMIAVIVAMAIVITLMIVWPDP